MQWRRVADQLNAGSRSGGAGCMPRAPACLLLRPASRRRGRQAFEVWTVATAMAQSSWDVARYRESRATGQMPVQAIQVAPQRATRIAPAAGCAAAGNVSMYLRRRGAPS